VQKSIMNKGPILLANFLTKLLVQDSTSTSKWLYGSIPLIHNQNLRL